MMYTYPMIKDAAIICIAIFEDYDELEIKAEPFSVQRAWEMGRELSAMAAEVGALADMVGGN